MENIDKIKCILIDFEIADKTLNEAANEILRLFSVVGQSEQLKAFCEHLNTYKGLEDCRFDFMLIDFLDKSI